MKLSPPFPLSPGRCDWLFNHRGYQCSEAASSGFPTLDEAYRFKWVRMCGVHREEFSKLIQDGGGLTPRWSDIPEVLQ